MSTTPLLHLGANDAPIACTLTPEQHRARTAQLSELARSALVARTPIAGGERLTFGDALAAERELRAALAAEAACCSFLTMRLERAEGGLVLDVTGPEQAAPVIAALFAYGSNPPHAKT